MNRTTELGSAAVFDAADVTVHYGATVALTDLNVHLDRGTLVAVIGPNGSGKSTLLRLIAGLLQPSIGTVHRHVDHASLVLQTTDIDPGLPLTVIDAVRLGRHGGRRGLARLLGRLDSSDHDIVRDAMERLDVADLGSRRLQELSGGHRQRVLVAQGLAQQSDLLLLDEPTNGLDVISQERIHEVIAEERARGCTVVATTHSLTEARRADLVLLVATRLVAAGPPAEVLDSDTLELAFGRRLTRLVDGTEILDDDHHGHDRHGHAPL